MVYDNSLRVLIILISQVSKSANSERVMKVLDLAGGFLALWEYNSISIHQIEVI
jgi:hypothetical protein